MSGSYYEVQEDIRGALYALQYAAADLRSYFATKIGKDTIIAEWESEQDGKRLVRRDFEIIEEMAQRIRELTGEHEDEPNNIVVDLKTLERVG